MNNKVWVLCPNGHRVNVEVKPNTPLSSIRQQACDKHGFNPANYGIRRENQKGLLDLSFPFRLSGLPNKAKLELVEESQKDVLINIALQLDTGQRLLGKCLNTSTLKHTIHSIAADIESVSYVMYLQQKIDEEDLNNVKLSDLGIFKGSALLRLHDIKFETVACSSEVTDLMEESSQCLSVMETDPTVDYRSKRSKDSLHMDIDEEPNDPKDNGQKVQQDDSYHNDSIPILFDPIKSGHQMSTSINADEEFYEVNDRDLKILLRDLHKISERQFRFKEPEKEKHIPEKVVLRIRFPNGTMLQNIFNARVDTTDTLYDFVKKYLTEESSEHLNIYQAPPKNIIKAGLTFPEAGLVCTSLLHAGGDIYLKKDLIVETDSSHANNQLTGVLKTNSTSATTDDLSVTNQNAPSSSQQNNNSQVETPNKSAKPVPKWFKMK